MLMKSQWWIGWVAAGCLVSAAAATNDLLRRDDAGPRTRVTIVHDPQATVAFEPQLARVRIMVERGLTNITAQPTVAAAWRSLVSTQDVVGIKVFSAPGPNTGTRPAVVTAIVESLLAAGIPPQHVVVWDKQLSDLRQSGFVELAGRLGVRVAGSANAGYDRDTFYEPDIPFLGPLLWSDLEFGQLTEGTGRKSFVSTLVSQELTKIVNVPPLLNHYGVGVVGNLYNLTFGSADNLQRFEINKQYLAQVVPELYALPAIGDKVVLSIVDALLCQYEGQQTGLLHYSTVVNELRFSKDPVALDLLSLEELERQRLAAQASAPVMNKELFANAALLELGVGSLSDILLERLP